MPDVSIIIPVYNAARSLALTLQSVTNQTHLDWECICIDDGSTDESVAIIQTFVTSDSRYRLICQRNGGPGVARNTGLGSATGSYFAFVDADDVLHPECLRRLVDLAEEYTADLVMCDYQIIAEYTRDVAFTHTSDIRVEAEHAPLFPKLADWRRFRVHPWGKLFRSSVFGHLQFPKYYGPEDAHFHLDTFLAAHTLVVTSEKLYFYRECANALTRTKNRHGNYIAGSEGIALHCEDICRANAVSPSLAARLQMCYGTNRIFIELADMAGNPQLGDAQRRELIGMACGAVGRITRAVAGRHRVVALQHLLTYLAAIRLHSLWWLKRVSGLRRLLIRATRAGATGRGA